MDYAGAGEVPYKESMSCLYRFKTHDPLQVTVVLDQQIKELRAHVTRLISENMQPEGTRPESASRPMEENCPALRLRENIESFSDFGEALLQQQVVIMDTLTSIVHASNQDCKANMSQSAELQKNSARDAQNSPRILDALMKTLISRIVAEPLDLTALSKFAEKTEEARVLLSEELSELHDLVKERRELCMREICTLDTYPAEYPNGALGTQTKSSFQVQAVFDIFC